MKTIISIIVIILVLLVGRYGYLAYMNSKNKPIGGDRDSYGCLVSAGYAYDSVVGACIRDFEMTPDIKQAAKLAVDYVGRGYALTVASFNSYEEVGAYDIMLERGEERTKQTVYIKNWQVVRFSKI